MRILKRLLHWTSISILILTCGLVVSPPRIVEGAPQPQGTVTPRPTPVLPTLTLTPPPGSTPTSTPPPGVTATPGGTGGGGTGAGSTDTGKAVVGELSLALTVDKKVANPGDDLLYKAQIANVAGKEATNVWLTSDLPSGVEVQEVTTSMGKVNYHGQRISIELGRMPASYDSQYVSILVRVRDDVDPGTGLLHLASLTSDQSGGGEASVLTTVSGDEPRAKALGIPLPVTGGGSIPLWMAIGFVVLIVAVAVFSMRGRALPPR